jgi:glutamate N-acetyltransferase/amino-acid N-acetyltransferase
VFTTNLVKAAPVLLAQKRVKRGRARAVLVNAGCANACTGREGIAAATRTCALLASALGIPEDEVVPASTGVIGAPLPVARFEAAMPALVADLAATHGEHFADAICTTDRWRKVSEAAATIGDAEVRAVGIAKGAGMIHPNMATTLLFVLTDARADAATLHRALRAAADQTINCVAVDGDTSTNDMLLALASGRAEGAKPVRGTAQVRALTELFAAVLDPLARSIAADGEGSEHLVTVEVSGAPSPAGARAVARTIATSPLVKTALHGKDPNWGRILAAAGRSGVRFDPARASIAVGDVMIVRGGVAVGGDAEARAHEVMLRPAYAVHVNLGPGRGRARYYACDLGHKYVDCNASYRS